jgi:carbon-monoxide dehydrogenase medium subunit
MIQPYPGYPEFEYVKPLSVEEAVSFLKNHPGQSRPYAGGTDCFMQLRDRRIHPKYLVDLKAIPGLDQITFERGKGLTVGAAVTLNQLYSHPELVKQYPVLLSAIHEVGSYQLRMRATLIGNLCNASPCGDTIGPCLVYGASLEIFGLAGKRELDLAQFFLGPGKTALQPDEIVTAITLPVPSSGCAGAYKSIGRNKLGDLAIAAVTALGCSDADSPSGFSFRIALTAVAPTVIFAEKAQMILYEKPITTQSIENAAVEAGHECQPIDDIRGSAAYRSEMITVLTRRALISICEQLHISL